nr:class I adenylate-forming enzyme family protein [Aquamicrobium lusatiense]
MSGQGRRPPRHAGRGCGLAAAILAGLHGAGLKAHVEHTHRGTAHRAPPGEGRSMRPTQAQIDRYHQAGLWGTETIEARFRANVQRLPDRLALADAPNRTEFSEGAPRRLTYAALDREVERLTVLLRSRGVTPGDVVVYQLPNIIESVALLLACLRAGAIASPLLVQYDRNEVSHVLDTLKPRVFVAGRFKSRDLAAEAEPLCQALSCALLRTADLLAAPAPAGPVPVGARDADDVATICWTSGTEGQAKGVMRTSNNWFVTGRNMYFSAALRDGDVILNTRPLVNMAAIGGSFMSWLVIAGTMIMHHPLDIPLVIRQIRDERVTMTLMPPAFFVSLLKDEALRADADLSSLRLMGTGSAAIPAWAIDGIEREFGIEIVNFFGSNEGTSLLSTPREVPDPALRATHFPRFGRPEFDWPTFPPTHDFTTQLVDPATGDEITEPNRAGELRIAGPGIFLGYAGEPALTAAAFDQRGRYRTGDLFEIAGTGPMARYYRFVGRNKDIIIRGGLKIAPAELDDIIAGFDAAAEAAFFGCDDDRLGEIVGVAVVPRPGRSVSLDDVVAYLKERRVAVFKLPQRLVLLDALPRNALMKVQRNLLRDMARDVRNLEEGQE